MADQYKWRLEEFTRTAAVIRACKQRKIEISTCNDKPDDGAQSKFSTEIKPAQDIELKECSRCNVKKDKFNSFDKNNQGRIKPYSRSCDRGKCIKCEVEKQRDEFAKSDKICKECREKAKLEPWFVSRFCFGTDNFGRTERLKYGQGPKNART